MDYHFEVGLFCDDPTKHNDSWFHSLNTPGTLAATTAAFTQYVNSSADQAQYWACSHVAVIRVDTTTGVYSDVIAVAANPSHDAARVDRIDEEYEALYRAEVNQLYPHF